MNKTAIFEVFAEYNIFETFEDIMVRPTNVQVSLAPKISKKDNKKTRESGVPPDEVDVKQHLHMILEILMLSLVQAAHCLRDYCVSQTQKFQKYPLLTYIVNQTINHDDPIIQNMVRMWEYLTLF